MSDMQLPQAPEAELGLLSSLLLSPLQVAAACRERRITHAHFFVRAHGETYTAIMELLEKGVKVDFIALGEKLREMGRYEMNGGAQFVSGLFTYVASASTVTHYLEIVKEKALARRVLSLCTKYGAKALEVDARGSEVADALFGEVMELCGKRQPRKTVKQAILEIRDEIVNGKPDGELVLTGWDLLDKRLHLYRGDFIVITAPTSCGKSALALHIELMIARSGKRTGFYGLEMQTKQNVKRALANLGQYHPDFVRNVVQQKPEGDFTKKVVADFCATADTIVSLPFYVRDDLFIYEAIIADIRCEHASSPLTMAVVDYLQLIRTLESRERRQLEIARMTQGFKQLAQELGIIICTPSQVNADGHTREAADAENDCNALLKIVSKEDAEGNPTFDKLLIWKQREGERFVEIPVTFDGRHSRFDERK